MDYSNFEYFPPLNLIFQSANQVQIFKTIRGIRILRLAEILPLFHDWPSIELSKELII